jgi:hypothetical protein
MLKQITIIFILSFIITSCEFIKDKANPLVLNSNNLIAYIENPSQKGGNGLDWGHIVIFDIDTKEKHYVTDKESYINNPVWLANTKELIYAVAVDSYDDPSYPLKFKWGRDIVLFNAETGTTKLLFPNLEKSNQKFYILTRKVLGYSNNIFLIPQFNSVYQLNTTDYEINKIIELDSVYRIQHIDLSPNRESMIIGVSNTSSRIWGSEQFIYNIKDSLLLSITDISFYNGGWSSNSEDYLFFHRENILRYNRLANSLDTIFIPLVELDHIAYTKDNNIIGLAKNISIDNKSKEIFLFDIKEKKISWLTNDGIRKKDISVLL